METKIYSIAEWLTYNQAEIETEYLLSGVDDVEDFIFMMAEMVFARDINPEELNIIFDDNRICMLLDFLYKGRNNEQTNSLH